MDLYDSAEEARFRARLRNWLHTTVGAIDDPRRWAKMLHDAGYAGLTWPTVYGGGGLPVTYQGIFAEECARAGAPEHPNIIGLNMVGPTLLRFGTEAQRQRHLAAILTGDDVFCQGFSEPDAGSDLAAIRTAARRFDRSFRVSGEKVWSSYAHLADHCLLLARTGAPSSRHAGLTCFLLDMRAPGVEVRPLRMISGDADFCQIVLRDVEVPLDAVVGEVDAGWTVAMTTLAHERGTFAVALTARLARQFDCLTRTVHAVGSHGDPIVAAATAELYTDLDALRQTCHRALATLERTGVPGPESAILKLHWSRTYQRLVEFAWSLVARHHSGSGDVDWRAYWLRERLRSRGSTIEGGTSEVLLATIAERVCGLPRSR